MPAHDIPGVSRPWLSSCMKFSKLHEKQVSKILFSLSVHFIIFFWFSSFLFTIYTKKSFNGKLAFQLGHCVQSLTLRHVYLEGFVSCSSQSYKDFCLQPHSLGRVLSTLVKYRGWCKDNSISTQQTGQRRHSFTRGSSSLWTFLEFVLILCSLTKFIFN